jgi:hypothetical protein
MITVYVQCQQNKLYWYSLWLNVLCIKFKIETRSSSQQRCSSNCVIGNTCMSAFSIQSCRSRYAPTLSLSTSFYKIFVKFKNSKKNVLKIVLIIVNINKDENNSLISNQFSLKNDLWSFLIFTSAKEFSKNCSDDAV